MTVDATWHCTLCNEDKQGFVHNHFRLIHPDEYERWSTEHEPAFEIIHYQADEDATCCWTHQTPDGEEFQEGDVAAIVDLPNDVTSRVCLVCFEAGVGLEQGRE